MRSLSHVFWIGGSPCSGKSSIADLLVERHNLQLYRCDDHYTEHLERATREQQPLLVEARGINWSEFWSRAVDVAVRHAFEFYRQEFGMVLEDLHAMPDSSPILAEGGSLLPECLAPLVSDPHRAVWVVPTAAFQLEHYSRRDWIHGILRECENPQAAFANWMGRDVEFAKIVARDATQLGFPVVIVDGSQPVEAVARSVEGLLNLPAR